METHALAGNMPPLDKLDAPLSTLSENLGVKWMGVLISIGAMISFFALALSCLNAGSRVLFTMGRYGIFPISVGSSHKHNLTPHVAITSFALVQFLIPTSFILLSYAAVGGWQMAPFDAFNDAGLFGAMGFCGAYVLISLATPFYLKKIGELKAYHVAVAVIALALLVVPIVGTVYPVPPAPLNYFPYIFGAYLLVGVILVSIRSRTVQEMAGIRRALEETAMASDLDLPVPSELLAGNPDAFPGLRARGLPDGEQDGHHDNNHRFSREPPSVSREVHDGRGPQRGIRHAGRSFRRSLVRPL